MDRKLSHDRATAALLAAAMAHGSIPLEDTSVVHSGYSEVTDTLAKPLHCTAWYGSAPVFRAAHLPDEQPCLALLLGFSCLPCSIALHHNS